MNKKGIYAGVILLLLVVGPQMALGTRIVQIDIKPGDEQNIVNLDSKGLIPVAILTEVDEEGIIIFDASQVQVEDSPERSGITLNGVDVAVRGKAEKSMSRLEDVNGDSYLDVLIQVETEYLGNTVSPENGQVVLSGFTLQGDTISGEDEITVVPPQP